MKTSRRTFLRALGAGAGAGVLSAALGPHIWSPRRRAFAAPSGDAIFSSGAIFFVLNGGARTQSVFNGAVGMGANPFGQLSGLPVPLSAVMQGSGLDDPAVNQRVNLVTTCQHHNRTGNHGTGRVTACTGYAPADNRAGILSIVNFAFAFRDLPCVNIGNDTPTTLIGEDISSTFAPVRISSPLNVQDLVASLRSTAVSPAEHARMDALRSQLQDRFLRNTRYRTPADIPFFQRQAAAIAEQLDDAALDLRSNASLGQFTDGTAVTNAGLRTSFGVNANGSGNATGAQAMLALRLRQLGCAGITLSSPQNWDLHSNEVNNLPPRAFAVGQAIAGLVSNLARIPDPVMGDRTLLDTTVITVLTDFGRGNWGVGSGFNGNNGSDHRTNEDKTCLQCIPIIGGGLPGGRVLGQIVGDGAAAPGSPVYGTRQVLSTVLDLLGIAPQGFFPGASPLTQELLG
jgi:hypothetical protein